jgi:protein-disulfide isomerase
MENGKTVLFAIIIIGLFSFSTSANAKIPWKRVIGADISKMSSADKSKAKALMGTINSYYGCSDSIAKCLVSSPKCITARRVAGQIVRMVLKGRSDKKIKREIMLRAKSAHPFKKQTIKHNTTQCMGNPATAKVVIVVYSDFQCPFCAIIIPIMESIVKKKKNVALCFKNFPTLAHGQGTILASMAAVAASLQGKFWQFHDLLYKNRKNQSKNEILGYAKSIGLNMAKFQKDWGSRKVKRVVAKEKKEGLKLKVKGTPTFFMNGKKYYGRKDRAQINDRIEEELHLKAGGN